MRILVLSFYYEPDLCAGSFRNTTMVNALSGLLNNNDELEVITTLPNRYHTFSAEAQFYEEIGNIKIRRTMLPVHKSGMIDQSRAFISYARSVWKHTRGKSYDLIYASSSRLMTAFLGALLAKKYKTFLYLDIRDIFTDSMEDLLSNNLLRFVVPVLKSIEKFTIHNANWINLVSPGFEDHYLAIDTSNKYSTYTNGIDDVFIDYDFSHDANADGSTEILYAGNIGEGQGLHKIIPAAAEKLGSEWKIRIIGDGGMKTELQRKVDGLENVILEAPVPRKMLLERYKQADILFLHLNNHPAFQKVLPSKVFEYGATGKPIVAGVAGVAADFLRNNVINSSIFPPCDANEFIEAIKKLDMRHIPRNDFINNYRRSNIVKKQVKDIMQFAKNNSLE